DNGAKRDGYLRDEPRLRCLGGKTVHWCVLYLFTGGRIEGHRQEPVPSPPRRSPASNRLGIRARERAACRDTRVVVELNRTPRTPAASPSHGLDHASPRRNPCRRHSRLLPINGGGRGWHASGLTRASRRR